MPDDFSFPPPLAVGAKLTLVNNVVSGTKYEDTIDLSYVHLINFFQGMRKIINSIVIIFILHL
jgi:hypothetical protein